MSEQMYRSKNYGKLIIFEGNDGTGKTTQLKMAQRELEDTEYPVYASRVHGGTLIGEEARALSFSSTPRSPAFDLLLSAAMHIELAPVIEEKRAAGIHVLLDRGPFSMTAYQIYGDNLDPKMGLEQVDKEIRMFNPDLIIVYDAAAALTITRARAASGGKTDYFESKPDEYFERTRQGYLDEAHRFGCPIVPVDRSIHAVHRDTMTLIHQVLPLK